MKTTTGMMCIVVALGATLSRGATAEPARPNDASPPQSHGAPPEREDDEFEHTVVFGVGGAVEVDLGERSVHPGVNGFVEWNAVDGWLELELSASVLPVERGVEVPIGLLFKKPFRLRRGLEMMLGLGPEVVHASGTSNDGTFYGAELAVDFMWWPAPHAGLWVEPAYDLIVRDGASHSVGSTGGVVIGR